MNKIALQAIIKDRMVRQKVTRESHLMFFSIYFSHYITYELASFHREIFDLLQDPKNMLACIVSFRGSGKSTIVTMSYSIWSILGMQKKKFVLILCRTQAQALIHMSNLKQELETNELLKSDLGPFREDRDTQWAASSLVFPSIGARITIASLDQSIRGIRHRQYRPDVIILDDIEDVASVKTFESRSKTFDWFTREIIPLGDIQTRILIVGNLLHNDSLVMRLKKKIQSKEVEGVYREYPLINDDGDCLWSGKFPTKESLEDFKKKIINESAWLREYLLKIIDDDYQIVKRTDLHYYDHLPDKIPMLVVMGIDPAISVAETADYTAIVSGLIYEIDQKIYMYILPNPLNVRVDFGGILATVKSVRESLRKYKQPHIETYVESVGFQRVIAQQLVSDGVPCLEFAVPGDKKVRLSTVSHKIQDGSILFPESGTEGLIMQMVGLGSESHDDLVDAFTVCAHRLKTITPYLGILWG